MSPATARRELEVLVRAEDAQGVRAHLDGECGPALGVGAPHLERLLQKDDGELLSGVRHLLRREKVECLALRDTHRRRKAHAAAVEVARTARFKGGAVYLDRELALGPLLAQPGHVLFVVDEHEIAISVSLLRRAARATKVFEDLYVLVDRAGFYLRWNGGRGGLSLRPQQLDALERREAVVAAFRRPIRTSTPRSVLRDGSWLCEVLEHLIP